MPPAFISNPPLFFNQSSRFPLHQHTNLRPTHRFPVMSSSDSRHGILMLCLGNICRSPAAEAVMNGVLERRNLNDKFFVDSCGTGGGSPSWYMEGGYSYHEGQPADQRMRDAAVGRGLTLESRSRPLNRQDFDKFDFIVAMDHSNLESIDVARRHWNVPKETRAKVVLLSRFSPDEAFRGRAIPDPYYSGPKGFDYALDLIEGACEGLADHLSSDDSSTS